MLIGGFQKFSLIDYPGKVSAIVFTQGCNFRCPYCHNPELVEPKLFQKPLDEEMIFSFLETRKGKLDGIVITGGEPTLQKDLPGFIRKIKSAGFLVKLDSNGTNPGMLNFLIKKKLIDYIAMDIKAPLEKYEKIIHVKIDTNLIKASIEAIMNSGISYEFRTTFSKEILTMAEIISIGKLIKGAKIHVLQKMSTQDKILSPIFMKFIKNYSDEELYLIKQEVSKYVVQCIIR
jgi:pyruvate formate lyase activating enzyme